MNRTRTNLLLAAGTILGVLGLFVTDAPLAAAEPTTECAPCSEYVDDDWMKHNITNACCLPNKGCFTVPVSELGVSGSLYGCAVAHTSC
jgi:hypothetical protein